jgi:tight adherence protein B
MTPEIVLSSLLIFASIAGIVYFGRDLTWGWFKGRAERDAAKYSVWIDELFLDWTPEQARQAAYLANGGVLAAALIVLLFTGSVIFAGAAAFAAYFVPMMVYKQARTRRLKRFEEQLPDAIDTMVASVRAGRSLAQAIEDVAGKIGGPAGEEFGIMASEYRDGGLTIEETLRRTMLRLNIENFTLVASALIINSERGGDVLTMLERMSTAIREISRLQKKIISEMAEVRAQEKIILTLTPIFGGMVCLFDPEIPGILFKTIPGNLLLVAVIGTQVAGIMWIRRIVKTTI